jgi:ribosomal protein S18 acetylase RimI-like enzyme
MIKFICVEKLSELEKYMSLEELGAFLHSSLKPFEDSPEDIGRGLEYAFSPKDGKGGFILLARDGDRTVGALVMLRTGMSGFVPPNILLYIAVSPENRGRGIGGGLLKEAFRRAEGDIKLHVEYDNPAKRLYERMGFRSKYAEMRYSG